MFEDYIEVDASKGGTLTKTKSRVSMTIGSVEISIYKPSWCSKVFSIRNLNDKTQDKLIFYLEDWDDFVTAVRMMDESECNGKETKDT